ncbi:hypothetical protein CSA56_17325 [candidate division KSB3 bacterium]|uniref:Uncharacterized protein n=1 Tax=candidate division KSB3 bacterium TaxID=2044937 RepID=A0A2G6K7W5_9BACT|nr:MAG: hypothetical protein CSA56_17325 [candidate division KSB3 bacterium]
MMKEGREGQRGVTLIEMLVTVVILGFILAGIYSMLNVANKTFLNTRALVENNQTSRQVLNYLLLRLREIDGSGLVKDPRYCKDCHTPEIDNDQDVDDPYIPCKLDVRIPRRTLLIENLTTLSLPTLSGIDATYQNLSGYNSITFWADMLPVTGYPDEFTDSPSVGVASSNRNGVWDLTYDKENKNIYDPGSDREVLYYDVNDDGEYDFYAEKWSFFLRKHPEYNSFELMETLSFEHTTDKGGYMNFTAMNASSYEPYTAPVAYGLTGLGIKPVLRFEPGNFPNPRATKLMDTSCGMGSGSSDIDKCHGNKATNQDFNIYQNETAFDYAQFTKTHPWWNIKAFSLEVATVDPQGKKFMKMKQVLIPRNLEVNQEYYVEE